MNINTSSLCYIEFHLLWPGKNLQEYEGQQGLQALGMEGILGPVCVVFQEQASRLDEVHLCQRLWGSDKGTVDF